MPAPLVVGALAAGARMAAPAIGRAVAGRAAGGAAGRAASKAIKPKKGGLGGGFSKGYMANEAMDTVFGRGSGGSSNLSGSQYQSVDFSGWG